MNFLLAAVFFLTPILGVAAEAVSSGVIECPCVGKSGQSEVFAIKDGQFICCDGSVNSKYRTYICSGCVDPDSTTNKTTGTSGLSAGIVPAAAKSSTQKFKPPACCEDKSIQISPAQLSMCGMSSCEQLPVIKGKAPVKAPAKPSVKLPVELPAK